MPTLQVGDPAPPFTLPDEEGRPLSLAALRGRRVVLFFYPRDDTPGCTRQACGFRDAFAELAAAGALVLGVSGDDASSHARFKARHGLPYPLLVDQDHALARAYGAWGEKSMYGRKYQGILRSHVVIGPDGRLEDLAIKVSPEESVRRARRAVKAARPLTAPPRTPDAR